jgi:F-type H+-transporting ATPase subunit b
MTALRLTLAALLLAALAVATPRAQAQPEHAPAAAPQHEAKAEHTEGEAAEHDPGWAPTLWKAANFVLLIGALTYFLRTPLMGYLDGRIAKVREDLVTAAQTRETAARQLAEIDAKLKSLPAELESLKRHGAADLAAERAQIEQDAQSERQRLLEHTRREIEMRLRVAKRELLELGATLAVNVAGDRIKASITPDDQTRLVDRYSAQIQATPEVRQ